MTPLKNELSRPAPILGALMSLVSLAAALISPAATAGMTDISNNPLSSTSTAAVKPNIMYLMDTSGSMDWTYMGDTVGNYPSAVGYKNNACNGVYYNPNINYLPPMNANGTPFAPASFTAAPSDGYAATTTTVNLSTSFKASNETAQPAYYYVYSGTQTLVRAAAPCTDNDSSTSTTYPTLAATGGGSWTKVQVTSTSGPGATDERQNFANWYSYYRKRIFMIKAAASRVFSQLDSKYRVGLITISPGSPVTSADFVPIGDFTPTQKATWFANLFSQQPANSTPLREALSRVGWYYAGKLNTGLTSGMTVDPVQYSCQQNFTILTTDGYWNGNPGQDLNGNAVGNQDGNITITPRPMYDGATAATVVTDVSNHYYTSTKGCSSKKKQIWYTPNYTSVTTPPGGTNGTTSWSGTSAVASWISGNTCSSTTPTLPSDGRPLANQTPAQQPQPPSGCTWWPCTSSTTSGGSSDSLADVAQYYYNTDLRPSMTDNVPSNGTGPQDDKAPWQHMTTFTMGLGIPGTLVYDPNYKNATSGDFYSILMGSKNWPVPIANDPTALDDLWHAAVDGRGLFFSAGNPDAVISGFGSALAGINARIAAAAAAATSNLEPVAGDNFAYTPKYLTLKWTGEVEAHQIDLGTGAVLPTVIWSAQTKLDTLTSTNCDNRTIWLFRGGATNNLTPFTWNTTSCTSGTASTGLNSTEQANFSSTQVALLSQYPNMTDGTSGTVDQRTPAAGANLVNFLRGQRGNEGFITNTAGLYYRVRDHVLGDIINAQPVYVKAPFASYTDAGYSAFQTANASRTPMVYSAANDGMLHAFYAGTSVTDTQGGVEAWAFIPTAVLPNLYRLADNNYANLHTFYTDGTPTAGDVCVSACGTTSAVWKTILVAGFNAGGKGYYALDITDPLNPKGLWEFNWSSTCYSTASSLTWGADCNLGYTFGNPVISKLANGKWVVMVTSGYNNVSAPASTGDGLGYLYVLDAVTGQIISKISTGVGDTVTPSGLGKIANWVDNGLVDNTTQRVYGGDLLGNVWRIDVNGASGATRLATLLAPDGTAQSITTRPELGLVGSPPAPYVFVATGRYLGTSDLQNSQVQSIYAFLDPLTSTPYANLRTALSQMTITDVGGGLTATRTITCTSNCTSQYGWFTDLPDMSTDVPPASERVNIDPKLVLGTLIVASNVPTGGACTIGGYSWLNYFNFANGNAIGANVGQRVSDSLVVGLNVLKLPDGRIVVNTTTSDAAHTAIATPTQTGKPDGKAVGWREIIAQ